MSKPRKQKKLFRPISTSAARLTDIPAPTDGSLISAFPDDLELATALGNFAAERDSGVQFRKINNIPIQNGEPGQCFLNVEKAFLARKSGRPVFGWYFFDKTPINDPTRRYVCGVHHCIYLDTNTRRSVCVSPLGELMPVKLDGRLLFLEDSSAKPIHRDGYSPIPLANRFVPITRDPGTLAFVARMNSEAAEKFERQLKEIDEGAARSE